MDRRLSDAVANNASWCALVCRLHGLDSRLDDDAWTCPTRTPPLHPDAVTLVPDPSIDLVLDRVDRTEGCSIKDSFASLDLSSRGWRVLLTAEWIVRPPTEVPPTATSWEVVHDRHLFAAWERAWRGPDGPGDVLRTDLLREESVAIVAGRERNRVVAGALLHRSHGVVSVSNFFVVAPRTGEAAWASCVALAGELHPGALLVGYEAGEPLRAACANGFRTMGPLQVWRLGSDT